MYTRQKIGRSNSKQCYGRSQTWKRGLRKLRLLRGRQRAQQAPLSTSEPTKATLYGGPDNQLITKQRLTCYSGHLATHLDPMPVKDMEFNWHGAPIPLALWGQIVAFLKWSYDTYDCEAQCRLSYNEKRKEWGVAVLPQTISTGLFTKEVETHADRETAFNECGLYDGFSFVGTVHHHCGASAFQSGTDHKDELTQPGFHVTLGHLNTKQADFHCRGSFRGIMYPTIDKKDWLPYTDEELTSLENLAVFPKVWESRLVKAEPVVHKTWKGAQWSKGGSKWGNGKGVHGGYAGQGYSKGTTAGVSYSRGTSLGDYEGFGVGMPDLLPAEAKSETTQPYWLVQREYFWDYMMAAYDVADLEELDWDLEIGYGCDLRAQACKEGIAYATLMYVEYTHNTRMEAHKAVCKLLRTGDLIFNADTSEWTSGADRVVVNLDDVVKKSAPSDTKLLATPKVVKKETESYEFLEQCTFDDILSVLPVPPKGLGEESKMVEAVETLFDEVAFQVQLEDQVRIACLTAPDLLFDSTSGVEPTEELFAATQELATSYILGLRGICKMRGFLEELTTNRMEELFSITPLDQDNLLEVLATQMSSMTLPQIEAIAKLPLTKLDVLSDWLGDHILDLVVKVHLEN